ncbi:uncharacterized protein I303_100779 [Kwoniella dejecticola CBS 10117]|uniref:Uncharacterized protein n=1 Tax=Kwoniella dejecticola CBS 10117 TaxID=1296121 RepID=A0A1A6AFX6_9TREE|nr:uncharacterized protein I303_00781 [Kwoniella dejecticola CBS 10117]OBR88961.1 hypothetical protein I303_00781 [Kwoniella dejecticola CBS 10117]
MTLNLAPYSPEAHSAGIEASTSPNSKIIQTPFAGMIDSSAVSVAVAVPVKEVTADAEQGTIPFLSKHKFSRFITSSPTPKSITTNEQVRYGEVPSPKRPNTPSNSLIASQVTRYGHVDGKGDGTVTGIEISQSSSSTQTSYALSRDSALADFFRGSAEVTPLPRLGDQDPSQGYFIGWDITPANVNLDENVNVDVNFDGRVNLQGCVSETEIGWSKLGVRACSLNGAFTVTEWSNEVKGRAGRRGRGLGWLTI